MLDVTSTSPNPILGFNIDQATAKQFKELVVALTAWVQAQAEPPPVLDLPDGWTNFTPEYSLNVITNTVINKSNRKPAFDTIVYYAAQMKAGDWRKTGQAMIRDSSNAWVDGQHRAWASLLTGCSFPTYVITSVPSDEFLFAYIDNSKPRTPADALETAGMDGTARLAAGVVRIARRFDAGVMTPASKGKMSKPSPMEILRYAQTAEGLREAINIMNSEHSEAMALINKKDMAAFVGWKILSIYGEDVLDEFMTGLVGADTEGANASGDPLIALRKKLEHYASLDADVGRLVGGQRVKKKGWPERLAHIIKAFNAWHEQESMKTVTVRVDEEFPKFVEPEEDARAA